MRALRLLTIRPRGRDELGRALTDRGFEPAAVKRALDRLAEEGWLDELGAARSTVRVRGAKYGPRRIERELVSRGFPKDVVDAALSERDLETEARALRRALEQVWRKSAGLPAAVRRRRALDSLARRGFAAAKVSEMIDRLRHEFERGPRTLS